MLPHFARERSPLADASARRDRRAALSHTRGDLHHAALEAAACGVRHHLETLEAAGLPLEHVMAVNGGAQHDLRPQIVSDVTG